MALMVPLLRNSVYSASIQILRSMTYVSYRWSFIGKGACTTYVRHYNLRLRNIKHMPCFQQFQLITQLLACSSFFKSNLILWHLKFEEGIPYKGCVALVFDKSGDKVGRLIY